MEAKHTIRYEETQMKINLLCKVRIKVASEGKPICLALIETVLKVPKANRKLAQECCLSITGAIAAALYPHAFFERWVRDRHPSVVKAHGLDEASQMGRLAWIDDMINTLKNGD
jgi:hypothetical protein